MKVETGFPLIEEDILNCLSPYEKEFFSIEMGRPLEYYKTRLKMIGFENYSKVLDAACGIGQWALALAKLNGLVIGVDINIGRLLLAQELAKKANAQNLSFRYAPLESIPYEDGFFDAIFCYGAFWLTAMPKTLSEFYRLLKPGGRLYVNVDDWGFYLHMIIDRGIKKKNRAALRGALRTIANTILRRKSQVIVSEKKLIKMLNQKGFKIIGSGTEGSVNISNIEAPSPMYEPYYGLPSVVEVLAEKSNLR